jgi:hypothetical protein
LEDYYNTKIKKSYENIIGAQFVDKNTYIDSNSSIKREKVNINTIKLLSPQDMQTILDAF